MAKKQTKQSYVVCLNNDGYAASLEPRKIYITLPDETAARKGLMRVIDESGEDYLYPAERFAVIEIPKAVVRAFSDVA